MALGQINTNAYIIFVRNILDLSQAPPNAIFRDVDSANQTTGSLFGGAATSTPAGTVGGNSTTAIARNSSEPSQVPLVLRQT